jgi:hypothetical protein
MSDMNSEAGVRSVYPYHGHDEGLVVTQPRSGEFVSVPMTAAELAAREPARQIAADIYRHAHYAGVCYYELWQIIAKAMQPLQSERDAALARVKELEEAMRVARVEIAARIARPDLRVHPSDVPESLNEADRECIAKAFNVLKESSHAR